MMKVIHNDGRTAFDHGAKIQAVTANHWFIKVLALMDFRQIRARSFS